MYVLGIKPQISLAKSLIEDIVQQLGNAQVRLDMALSKREPRIPPKSPDSPKSSPGTPRSERISPFPGKFSIILIVTMKIYIIIKQ